ncbi:hypothetical protein MMC11_001613 [Xylographa trunciseda]|nr:hypothetical protein [Xylographa trunciseda]
MSVFSKIVSKAAKPITAAEFYTAFRHAWRPKLENRFQRLGLAVSGGVDSMALAYLCQSMKELNSMDRDGLNFQFRAYVVDHRARDGSTEEAMLVVNRLRRLGVSSRVLQMDWPQHSNPPTITNFESEARSRRYRLLGSACREANVESLLLAHHADDQAETVLVRLATGHKAVGLRGIQQPVDIPECWGIHGLYRSGGHELSNNSNPYGSIDPRADGNSISGAKSIPTEYGGISLYRPFLPFTKDRLIATCVGGGIEWVEDMTNQDLTLTVRNTARQLLNSGRLPVALQRPSMIALAKSAHLRVLEVEKSAEHLLHACDILSFDNRVGSLVVCLPKEMSAVEYVASYANEEIRRRKVEHLTTTVCVLLRRLMDLVSPLWTVKLKSLEAAAEIISASKNRSSGFTAGCVRFQRSEHEASGIRVRSWQFNSTMFPEDTEFYPRQGAVDKKNIWTLSRQPFAANRSPPMIFIPKLKATETFVFWDGRFWIHVQNDTPHDVCVRPLRMSDLVDNLPPEPTKASREWDAILHNAAPGHIRWTLPVIAFADDVILPYGEQRAIALPSLSLNFGKHNSMVMWAIRYKKVDLKPLHSKLEPNDVIHEDVLLDEGVTEVVP